MGDVSAQSRPNIDQIRSTFHLASCLFILFFLFLFNVDPMIWKSVLMVPSSHRHHRYYPLRLRFWHWCANIREKYDFSFPLPLCDLLSKTFIFRRNFREKSQTTLNLILKIHFDEMVPPTGWHWKMMERELKTTDFRLNTHILYIWNIYSDDIWVLCIPSGHTNRRAVENRTTDTQLKFIVILFGTRMNIWNPIGKKAEIAHCLELSNEICYINIIQFGVKNKNNSLWIDNMALENTLASRYGLFDEIFVVYLRLKTMVCRILHLSQYHWFCSSGAFLIRYYDSRKNPQCQNLEKKLAKTNK